MPVVVMDACALIAYLRNEAGADVIKALLLDPNTTCLVHALNLCEVYYDFLRAYDEATAQSAVADLQAVGLVVKEDMDLAFWQEAGKHKAGYKLSLADCFAIALANRAGTELVTSDHREFDPIAAADVCKVRFFR